MIDPITTANVQAAKSAPVKPEKAHEQPAARLKTATAKVQTAVKGSVSKVPQLQLDAVDLSLPAQARMMQQQGLTINQISVRLELDETTVTRYLEVLTGS